MLLTVVAVAAGWGLQAFLVITVAGTDFTVLHTPGHAPGARRDAGRVVQAAALAPPDDFLDAAAQAVQRSAELREDSGGGAPFAHQAQQEVLRANHGMAQAVAFLACVVEHESGAVIVTVGHAGKPPLGRSAPGRRLVGVIVVCGA